MFRRGEACLDRMVSSQRMSTSFETRQEGNKKMRILFMGTPSFAVPILQALAKSFTIAAVVTQPDRPKGRGHGVQYSPVKECALALDLPIIQPEKIKDVSLEDFGADIFVVVAYGKILPVSVLNIPPLGCVNIHASLLPKYRGAAPMQWAMLNGDTITGVTIIYMDKGIDTGDMIYKKQLAIEATDRFSDLHDKMAALSCECIIYALGQIEAGVAAREQQNNEEATYAPMLKKEDGLIDWHSPTLRILNQVRALDPWPGTYSYFQGQTLKIWSALPETGGVGYEPGEVIKSDSALLVKTADGVLSVTEIQGQGGKRMGIADYLRGRSIPVGTLLGS